MKIKIKKFHGVAAWKWGTNNDCCGICRCEFEVCCPDCVFPGEDCPPVWGKCNHAFHVHCIEKWLQAQNGRGTCPLDRQEWQYKKE